MNQNERNPLDSTLLRSFLVIADTGNLTEAAHRLSRTQSAISVQLRRLEGDLGAALFHRTPRGMVLTEAGERLRPKARRILSDLREAGALFRDPLTGSVRVGLPDDFDRTVLEAVISGFGRAHPGVTVMARSGCTSGYAAAIRDDDLDIAVCSGPENALGETLEVERPVWAAKSGTVWPSDAPVALAVLDRSCWWRALPARSLDAVGRPYRIAFRSSSFAALEAAIKAGFAVGILPATSLDATMRALSRADGFPDLPRSRRSIVTSAKAPTALTDAMAAAIRRAVRAAPDRGPAPERA